MSKTRRIKHKCQVSNDIWEKLAIRDIRSFKSAGKERRRVLKRMEEQEELLELEKYLKDYRFELYRTLSSEGY